MASNPTETKSKNLQEDVERDWRWADTLSDQVKRILMLNACHILTEVKLSSAEQDLREATDMVVQVNTGTVAIRVRRPGFTQRDLTIRAVRKSGAKTELQKIIEGHARYYLYCWTENVDERKNN